MASNADMDFNCPVCLEVYKNPVVLSCSHSFCKACLQDWWTQKVTRECPVCKRRSSKTDPPCNLVLKNLCEAFSQQLTLGQGSSAGQGRASVQHAPLCPQHKEKLQLFCEDHQQLVCLVCRDSRAHHRHRFSPIDETAQDYREQLRKSLEPLQDRLKKCNDVRQHWNQTREHIKQQGQHTERLIQGQFDQMRAFLQREEQVRIRALRTEVQQKSNLMEQRLAALSQEVSALSQSISQTEKELRDQDIPFLQNYTSTVRQVQQVHLQSVPELPAGSLVDVAKHLGNLGFNIWIKMKEMVSYTPVVLDPNTASPSLVVSDDLCSAHFINVAEPSDLPWFPHNPERFDCYSTALGSEGFSSGSHFWEVEVQDMTDWSVGVIGESEQRKGDSVNGYWEIWFEDGKYKAFAPSLVDKVLTLRQHPQRIRVNVDMDRRKVSFTDSQTNSHIYTFTDVFNKKLVPFINTCNPRLLKILPVTFTVNLGQ